MSAAEIGALLKDVGGYGLAAFFAWMWLQERKRNNELQDARLIDVKEIGAKALGAIDAITHAMDKLEETVKAKP
ncbi:MAG: hypothetical protein KIT32_12255 [Rhodocyclaceae bacterium]|nr:hypothetical protein [Rhodocyclaceae bacterium]